MEPVSLPPVREITDWTEVQIDSQCLPGIDSEVKLIWLVIIYRLSPIDFYS